MPRTLSGTTSSAIAGPATRPITLVQVDYSTPIRISSNKSLVWNSLSWSGGGTAGYVQVVPQGNGAAECQFLIPDPDNTIGAYVLNEGAERIRVQAWELSGDGPYATGDAVALFDGELTRAERSGPGWRFVASATATRGGLVPRLIIGPPLFNHVTPIGTEIKTPTEIFRLRPRRG